MERKILIADDHGLYRCGLKITLSNNFPDFQIIEATCGNDVPALLQQHANVALVLLDLGLPDRCGLDILQEIRNDWPALPVAILSADESLAKIENAFVYGAKGFISKTSCNEVILSAIQLILAGEMYVPHLRLQNVISLGQRKPTAKSPSLSAATSTEPHLTPRQVDVLRLIVEGYSNKEICSMLNLSMGTIKTHCNAIFRDLNVTNRIQAAQAARRRQLIRDQ